MRRFLACALIAGVLGGVSACDKEEPRPVRVGTDRVTVINLTNMAWRDVNVWLNDHYRVQQRDLAPGQRLEIPLRVFVAAFGQKFDPKKQIPSGIEVDAVAADGTPVKIVWGKGRRR
jgi:hypothetical protein